MFFWSLRRDRGGIFQLAVDGFSRGGVPLADRGATGGLSLHSGVLEKALPGIFRPGRGASGGGSRAVSDDPPGV